MIGMNSSKIVDVFIEYGEDATIPKYETPLVSGADLFAARNMVIRPFEKVAIPLNINQTIWRFK
jgi:dUTP pyrophosphatase